MIIDLYTTSASSSMTNSLHISSIQEGQTRFVDSLVPRIDEEYVNLNSFKQFDELLTHLESSLSQLENNNSRLLVIPSSNIFRILFTLLSRSPNCNWTISNSLGDSIPTTHKQVKANNGYYEESTGKPTLCDRSRDVLEKYINLLPDDKLYENLYSFMMDFMDLPRRVKRLNSDTFRKSKDILAIIRESPNKKLKRVTNKEGTNKSIEDNDVIVISDSEEEDISIQQEDTLIESEVSKFLNLATDLNNSFMENIHQPGTNDFALLLNKDSSPSPKTPQSQGIRIFDEPILSIRLNPKLNNFDLWRLVNWTFFCSGKSNDVFDSTYRNCHLIYTAHSATVHQLFNIIEFNLIHELQDTFSIKEQPLTWLFKQSTARRSLAMDQVLENSSLLLLSLLKQFGHPRSKWFDRLAEYVFNGLTSKTDVIPATCYEREKDLIKKDEGLSHQRKKKKYTFYNDNMDSMKLRFKILNIVHYWSLFFDKTTPDGINQPMSQSINSIESTKLIEEIARKFMYMEYDYWVEFYYSLLVDSKISLEYREVFLVNLSCKLLSNLTNPKTNMFSLKPRDDKINSKWRRDNLLLILKWMLEPKLYLGFIEDESYPSFVYFKQAWNKYNFVLGWMFLFALRDVTAVGFRGILDKDALLQECHKMDHMRENIFLEFIKKCGKPTNLSFKLSTEEIKQLKTKRHKWESFTSIVSTIVA